MVIETILMGSFLIWYLFYLGIRNCRDVFLFGGVLCLFVGMFVGNYSIGNFSTNVLVLIGFCFVMVALFIKSVKPSLNNAYYCLIVYGVLSVILFEVNSFFNCYIFGGIVVLIHVFNFDNNSVIQSVNLSLCLCEVLNIVLMLYKMGFAVVFSYEFIMNFVLLNVVVLIFKWLYVVVKRSRNEKIC